MRQEVKMGKLVIDGNSVYEIDEDCIQRRGEKGREKNKGREEESGQEFVRRQLNKEYTFKH